MHGKPLTSQEQEIKDKQVLSKNTIEYIFNKLEKGEITTEEANVLHVRSERVTVVAHLRREVRSALNKAVKAGKLGRLPKKGLFPEVYYHPNFWKDAIATRKKIGKAKAKCLNGCLA